MTQPHQATGSFSGFLDAQREPVEVPRQFFTDLLPEITDLGEMRVTLLLFLLVAERGASETPVPERQIIEDRSLREAFRVDGIDSSQVRNTIANALDRAVARGSLLRVESHGKLQTASWYFIHTRVTRELVAAIARGAISPPREMWTDDTSPEVTREPASSFHLYEQNIGPLTPLVADRITRAMDTYPPDWIEDAIGEAVTYNRRSWRYIERILETWTQQGRTDRSS